MAASDAASPEAAPEDAAAELTATPDAAAAVEAASPSAIKAEVSDEEDEAGSQAQGDDSSVEYAADLTEAPDDDEATLDEEEVCKQHPSLVMLPDHHQRDGLTQATLDEEEVCKMK